MAALRIKQVPIAKLRAAKYNPRRISKSQAEALEHSLTEFGAVDPAIVNADGTIIGGHQRVDAAQRLGWSRFPVVEVDLSDERARLLNLALNRISGEWDEDKLGPLLVQLSEDGADLSLSGFESAELDALLASTSEPDPEPIEPPAKPKTKPGDLYELGEHRLLCGDATSASDVERLMGGAWRPSCGLTRPTASITWARRPRR